MSQSARSSSLAERLFFGAILSTLEDENIDEAQVKCLGGIDEMMATGSEDNDGHINRVLTKIMGHPSVPMDWLQTAMILGSKTAWGNPNSILALCDWGLNPVVMESLLVRSAAKVLGVKRPSPRDPHLYSSDLLEVVKQAIRTSETTTAFLTLFGEFVLDFQWKDNPSDRSYANIFEGSYYRIHPTTGDELFANPYKLEEYMKNGVCVMSRKDYFFLVDVSALEDDR